MPNANSGYMLLVRYSTLYAGKHILIKAAPVVEWLRALISVTCLTIGSSHSCLMWVRAPHCITVAHAREAK